ncbi:Myb-like DNA-binding domain containing protein [Tritrichomonas foetus]|uniref:Myb-like DNA-binding domain containing protein n=1 Tax=Tritrichomonas foetus TaxID=1144522 RepID=A0A1J4JP36_9EUKA|nr:Myb-like DNA-binding domain containing protein [Tritrichomonas foetus]|eukprot:OHT00498.1 Myb-like DNA-binding domain containing protein [Tritrichomonas foetus]
MTEEPLGKNLLVEVGLSYVEGILPTIDTNEYDRLASTLTEYLNEEKTFEECAVLFQEVLGRDDPLVRVREILNTSDEPIPYSEEAQAQDENPHNRKKTRTWGGYEDQRLVAGVYKFGLDNWPMVAAFVGNGRTRAQCAQRWARGLNPRICKKHWSHAEDEQLKQLVQTYGEKAWTKIAAAFGNRSDVQCRYHYRQIVKGDEIPGSFMSLRRGTPVALSTQAFYNPQFPASIMQPQVYIMPTIPIAPINPVNPGITVNPVGPPVGAIGPQAPMIKPAYAAAPAPLQLSSQVPIMRMSMNTLPTAMFDLAKKKSNPNGPLTNGLGGGLSNISLNSNLTGALHGNNNNNTTNNSGTHSSQQSPSPTPPIPTPPQSPQTPQTQQPPIQPKAELGGIDSFLNHFK